MKLDLHVHTYASPDSLNKPEDISRIAKRKGIVPAITDHGTVKFHSKFKEIPFIKGEEIRTAEGDLIALYIEEKIPEHLSFEETLSLIKEQGGIAYLPHMYDKRRKGIDDEIKAKKVDVIEVVNGFCMEECNKKALEFAEKNGILKGVGSDSHLIHEFGNMWIEVEDFDIENKKEFLKALGKGRVVIKQKNLVLPGLHMGVKYLKKTFHLNPVE